MRFNLRSLILYFFLLFILGCNESQNLNLENDNSFLKINYSVSKILSHDTLLFTEGLVIFKDKLFESTGSPDDIPFTKSLVGYHDFQSSQFKTVIEIDKSKYFGEGIVFLNKKLYQLTYKNQKGFIYNSTNFKLIDSFYFNNKEGWGLTTDGESIIMSDGTSEITYYNPNNFESPIKKLNITEGGIPISNINELEFINGYIYANIWMANYIVKINPLNGSIMGKLDLSSIVHDVKSRKPSSDVLNGIAYDKLNDKVYITGKLWPSIYCIDFKK